MKITIFFYIYTKYGNICPFSFGDILFNKFKLASNSFTCLHFNSQFYHNISLQLLQFLSFEGITTPFENDFFRDNGNEPITFLPPTECDDLWRNTNQSSVGSTARMHGKHSRTVFWSNVSQMLWCLFLFFVSQESSPFPLPIGQIWKRHHHNTEMNNNSILELVFRFNFYVLTCSLLSPSHTFCCWWIFSLQQIVQTFFFKKKNRFIVHTG